MTAYQEWFGCWWTRTCWRQQSVLKMFPHQHQKWSQESLAYHRLCPAKEFPKNNKKASSFCLTESFPKASEMRQAPTAMTVTTRSMLPTDSFSGFCGNCLIEVFNTGGHHAYEYFWGAGWSYLSRTYYWDGKVAVGPALPELKHPLGADWSFHGILLTNNKGKRHEEKGHNLRIQRVFRNFSVETASAVLYTQEHIPSIW